MTEPSALAKLWESADCAWFARNGRRQSRIRNVYQHECEAEFRSLGDHDRKRRRVILWRVPQENPIYDPDHPQILKIPLLAFADETIEDTDEILLPEVHRIMTEAAAT